MLLKIGVVGPNCAFFVLGFLYKWNFFLFRCAKPKL
jgi:hypothetical protein